MRVAFGLWIPFGQGWCVPVRIPMVSCVNFRLATWMARYRISVDCSVDWCLDVEGTDCLDWAVDVRSRQGEEGEEGRGGRGV